MIMDSVEMKENMLVDNTANVEMENNVMNEVENQVAATPAETVEPITREGLLEKLRTIVEAQDLGQKVVVDNIRLNFYKLLNAEVEEARRMAAEQEVEVEPQQDPVEVEFKQLLQTYKDLRAAKTAAVLKEMEQNLLRKQNILEQLKALIEQGADAANKFPQFKALQQEWKEIGKIPETNAKEINKAFATYREQFYDLVEISNELREYDFKKNLEAKTLLCEAAEQLTTREDIVMACRELQLLHEQWQEIGPVAREMKDVIWNRFKEATAIVNKKHQAHFDQIHQKEEENLQVKTIICERIENIDIAALTTFKQWEEASQLITTWQEEWKQTGFAPKKYNQSIYERYRKACDVFFEQKANFYKQVKNELTKNLERKRSLCGEAEALKDSTDWKVTGDKLIALQKQWKEVGAVPHKYSDELWQRFTAACDYFFAQKKQNFAEQRKDEQANLLKKKEILAQIEALNTEAKNAQDTLRKLIGEYNAVGFVPLKDKNKLQEQFKRAVDEKFDKLNVDATHRRLDSFKINLADMESKGEGKLADERKRLLRQYDKLKNDIAVSENNICFFSAKSKKAEKLLTDMERKIASLKEELKLIETKINLIDEKFD
jgi:lipocalin